MALGKAGFTLGIRPVSSLLPHEETIPSQVERIAAEMKRDGIQKDPIIIDRESATVLDGMHRLAAFGALKVENAVCCAVDYSSRSVTLGRWARVYSLPSRRSFSEFLEPAGFTRRATLAEAFHSLESKEAQVAALTAGAAYLQEQKADLEAAFATVSSFDRLAEATGSQRTFTPEDDVDIPLQSERNMVLLVRRLGKDDVVTAGRTGKLFPCKTSMHRIDPRPVAVNFPVGELNDATSDKLKDRIASGEQELLPPDSLYEGRRYKERLLLLRRR
jgi:hypothetical protein